MVSIGHTTIHGTYGSTLWFFMETFAFGTFIRNYIIYFITDRLLGLIGIHFLPVRQYHAASQVCAILISPVVSTFIYRSVGAFWLARTAIDTFVCYNNCHSISFSNFAQK